VGRKVSCLLKPDAGEATVAGLDIATRGDDIRRVIGYMPDFLGVYDDLTVEEYLHFFGAAFKIPRKQRVKIVDEVLQLTDLREKRHAFVDSLSRGMQQRLGVARVLVHDPKVCSWTSPRAGLIPGPASRCGVCCWSWAGWARR
jgi:ABC-2 type transport system ATP-binding protein